MCDLEKHDWNFDGNIIECLDCGLKFSRAWDYMIFVNEEKKMRIDREIHQAGEITAVYSGIFLSEAPTA